MKTIKEKIFEATKTLNNIKNHDYIIGDYKMCLNEAEVVKEALNVYIDNLYLVKGEQNETTV